jgi:lauroyl/myristoyl acyltransferase
MALRWLAWWCDREQVRDTFYKVEYARFRAFAQELGIALSRAERAFVPSMMGNILEGYRLWDQRLPQHLTSNPAQTRFNALRNSRYRLWRTLAQTIAGTTHGMQEQGIEDGGNSLIAYSGFEHLQQARQAQRGVVLAGYHAALIRIPSVVLSYRLQTRDILTVSQTNAVRAEQLERASHAPVFPVAFSPVSAHTRIAVEAQQQLRQGGMVQILNDVGFETSGTFAFAIGGRDYQLKRGFAELALNTHATIVPYYARIAANGVMTTHFFPPHTPDSRQEARHDQVVDLLQHYATFLETSWRQSPESVRWRVINDHLNRRLASK